MRSAFVVFFLLLLSACTAEAGGYRRHGYAPEYQRHPRYYEPLPFANSTYYSRPVRRDRTYCWTEYTWEGRPYRECTNVPVYSYEPWYRQPRAEIYLHWEN